MNGIRILVVCVAAMTGAVVVAQTVAPVYRLYSYGSSDSMYEHLFTTSATERDVLDSWDSWQYECIAWYAYSDQITGSTPLYRLYCPSARQHHYTISETEYTYLDQVDTAWDGEGIQYYVFESAGTNTVPVYRFYHEGLILHHFTVDTNEVIAIDANPGWGYQNEGVAFHVIPVSGGGGGETNTGNVYYVATSGDNSNAGTRSSPWATPGYGSTRLQPGDTLVILGGTYSLTDYASDRIIPGSGTSNGGWITIQGENGNRPILVGGNDLATAVDLGGKSYVIVENLEITAATGQYFRTGITVNTGVSSNLTFRNLFIHHIDQEGINLRDVDGVTITNCVISYCGFGAIGGPAGEYGGTRNLRIYNCTLSYSGHYYRGGDGSDRPYDRPDGFGLETSQGPVEIADTTSEHNYGDGLDSKLANTTIRRCSVANNSCDGIKLWGDQGRVENTLIYGRGDSDTTTTPWSAIVIGTAQSNCSFTLMNLTVDDQIGENYLMHVQYDHPSVAINLTMQNCIFSSRGNNGRIFLGSAVSATVGYNLFYMPNNDSVMTHGTQTWTSATIGSLGTGNLYGDPRFISTGFATNGDYRVQSGSPALNAGSASSAPSTDINNNPRPQSGGVDIGAYEQ